MTKWNEHLDALRGCRSCPGVVGPPITGAVRGAKIMLVGQAPGPHESVFGRPFDYTAGKRLFDWFRTIGIEEDDFRARVHIAAVIRCFPGRDLRKKADRVPSLEEIARCGAHLDREVEMLAPRLVLAVGTLAARVLLGSADLAQIVGKTHRVQRAGHPFDLVVLPHPSGRSTWLNDPGNRLLWQHSMELIREHPEFRRALENRTEEKQD